jgi:hypothetical protein
MSASTMQRTVQEHTPLQHMIYYQGNMQVHQ